MGNEEVGKISYSVTIDVAALKAGTKSAEQAVKTSFNSMETTMKTSSSRQQKSLGDIVTQLGLLTAAMLAVRKAGNFLNDSISAANTYQSAMLGLESVSASFTGETDKATEAAKELASDGLMSVTDSANALKNLLASGFSLPEAINLLKAFKDNAAFGHQAALTFGESVRGATEGIKNGNSILVDNIGLTKNLSTILEEAGYSQQDLMKATSDASIRQALYNGLLKETAPFLGDSAKLAETAAGADSKLATSIYYLEARVGQLANTLRKDMINGLSDFVGGNQDAIISTGAGIATFTSLALVIPLAVKAVSSLKAALVALGVQGAIAQARIFGIIGIVSAIAGLVAGNYVENLLNQTDDASGSMTDAEAAAKKAASGISRLGNSSDDTAKKLAELDDKISKVNRDFIESLAKMVQDHEQAIKDITKQIKDENANYEAAVKERFATFAEEQGKEETEHLKKTKALQNQIDFLRKYNNASNKQKLSELQFSLAQENAQYDKRNAERQAKYDADVEAERISYEQKLTENQTKLDAEKAILEKHASDVASIRGVMLLDEIDLLKRGRQEQLASLEQQKLDAVGNAKSTNAALLAETQSYLDSLNQKMKNGGTQAGASFLGSIIPFIGDAERAISGVANAKQTSANVSSEILKSARARYNAGQITREQLDNYIRIANIGFASGGFTGTGGVNEVAGIVHKGEYVLPQSAVNQSTGLPKADAVESLTGGGSSNTFNITIPISGAIVSSPQDQRKFAEVIGKRLNEIMTQKGYKPTIQGV